MQKIIELTQKKLDLLIELRESKIYESCKYHLIKLPGGRPNYYLLFEISTGQIIKDGNINDISRFLQRRSIPYNLVYPKDSLK